MPVTPPTNSIPPSASGGGLRCRLTRGVLLFAVVVGLPAGGSATPAMAADTCANAAVRVQTGSTGLPDCRAYEMVTPPYKAGFPAAAGGFTDDGVVSYMLRGSIAGDPHGSSNNLYHGVRLATGWTTTPLGPPATIYNTSIGALALPVSAEAPDLRASLWVMSRRDEPAAGIGLWLGGLDGAFTRVGDFEGQSIRDVSDDLTHVVFNALLAGGSAKTALYELVGTGNSGPPRAVSVDNSGSPIPESGSPDPDETCLADMSRDGRVILFQSGCHGTGNEQLWARVAGTATVAVSGSQCTRDAGDDGGVCNGFSTPTYAGAARDGSRVYFTTRQQLVNGDVDQAYDLYACEIPAGSPAPTGSANPCNTLTEVSGVAYDADVQSVVTVSEDGSRVYFVARGSLADNLGVGDDGPRAGAFNLYMWDRSSDSPAGRIRYVARLADGSDPARNDLTRAQLTSDGRYLLFATRNRLVEADGDDAIDVYRYDASTHQLVRVSASVAGGGGNGAFDASIPTSSAMTADGSTVVFNSDEALSSSDTNGAGDVYSWRNGQVSLISARGGGALGITESGRDIFFATDVPVLAADRDIVSDIYVARVGGGFEPTPSSPPCFGDQCRGPLSQPPSLAQPPAAVAGSGGVAEEAPAFSLRAVSTRQRKALAAKGKVSLSVTTNVAGTVSARATATIGGRSVTVGSARHAMAAAGRVSLSLTLSKRARAQLASRGRLVVRVAVSHSRVALDRVVTLRLVKAKRA